MPVNLNLLPPNLQVSKGLNKVLKTLKALGVIGMVAFIVFCLGVGAFFIFSKISLNNLQKDVDQLKTQVKAQETSEQQLILLKDRLAKIASIKSTPNASKNIANVDSLFVNLSPNTLMSLANIDSTKIDISLSIGSNQDLTTFTNNIKNSSVFNTVELSSLGYSSGNGFTMAVSIGNK